MSEQGNRKPVLFAITGVAATIILFLAYHKYSSAAETTASSLHRSNAVRRSRRRWRRGHAPRVLSHDPIEIALQNLKERIESSTPYGRYDNQLLFTVEDEALAGGLFDLLPANLSQIYTILSNVRSMTDLEKDKLKFHIDALFVQNFFQAEFPSGWIIGDDVEILVQDLRSYGIDEDCVKMMAHYFDTGKPLLPENWDVRDAAIPEASNDTAQSDGTVERASAQQAIEALAGPAHDDESNDSDDDDADSDPGGSQNMLDLLYHIASEQAKREGFIHRTRECSSCGMKPIQGIRYQCANCYDYDLCEDCEAQQVHTKSHIFYKIRMPAPERSHIMQPVPVIYPGQPNAFPNTMPRELLQKLVSEVGMDKTEMEASYEQFKVLAGEQIPIEDDPAHLGMAINRHNFDMYFTPTSADRPPAPNLIYDRIFAFYDYHNDGVITLDEYIVGLYTLMDKSRAARLKRMFMGFDLDSDGFVDRRDFLRMFRAYYALSKELNEEMVTLQNELDDDIRDVVLGSQPISAAFSGHHFQGHTSRQNQDKAVDDHGDFLIVQGNDGVLANDTEMRGDRAQIIGKAAVRYRTQTHPFQSLRPQPESDEPLIDIPRSFFIESRAPLASEMSDTDSALQSYHWPPDPRPDPEDIVSALGADVPLDEITDPVDRSKIIYAQLLRLDRESDKYLDFQRRSAINEMWRRRQFYLDEEEGMSKPPGYKEIDSSEDEAASIDDSTEALPQASSASRRQSMRSRSSSKVRFDDSAIDTDHETRSNTSSRSIPVNERWGGFELSGPEREIGRELIYQTVQQRFNELLDPLFKAKEDEAMSAFLSKEFRERWKKQLDDYAITRKRRKEEKTEALKQADLLRTQALFSNGVDGTIEGSQKATQPRPKTPNSEHDETDHIRIMFGNSQQTPPTKASEEAVATSKNGPKQAVDKYLDPTLPQNKPNAPGFHTSIDNVPKSSANLIDIPPSPATLRKWLHDRKIEEEADKRGGYGRLSYREFCRIMIREADRDEITDTLGHDRTSRRRSTDSNGAALTGNHDQEDSDTENEDEKEDALAWNSTADLGSMSFCGSWLEMAQF